MRTEEPSPPNKYMVFNILSNNLILQGVVTLPDHRNIEVILSNNLIVPTHTSTFLSSVQVYQVYMYVCMYVVCTYVYVRMYSMYVCTGTCVNKYKHYV